MTQEEYLYMTTTGWKSGNLHEIEIWFVEYESAYYIVAEYGNKAHWVQNLQHNSAIQLRVGPRSGPGQGRIVDSDSEAALVARVKAAMEAKYAWGDGLIVELQWD
jgi:deazaflavin-dependent oxidoreductase (nitroreductase family)